MFGFVLGTSPRCHTKYPPPLPEPASLILLPLPKTVETVTKEKKFQGNQSTFIHFEGSFVSWDIQRIQAVKAACKSLADAGAAKAAAALRSQAGVDDDGWGVYLVDFGEDADFKWEDAKFTSFLTQLARFTKRASPLMRSSPNWRKVPCCRLVDERSCRIVMPLVTPWNDDLLWHLQRTSRASSGSCLVSAELRKNSRTEKCNCGTHYLQTGSFWQNH